MESKRIGTNSNWEESGIIVGRSRESWGILLDLVESERV